MKEGWSRKVYLQMQEPTEVDHVSLQARLLRALGEPVRISPAVLRQAHEICRKADYQLTAVLGFDGRGWELLRVEPGDTTAEHYGLCADLGSTTMIMQMIHMNTGNVVAEESIFNPQIAYGEDILTRIFYTKDQPGHREELQRATAQGFTELMKRLEEKTGIPVSNCAALIVSGNTTMIHFLLGLDAFGIFQSPYAVQTLEPEVCRGADLGIPLNGFVYCMPALANYLGGDIISGMLATGIPEREEISVFLDVGTNGELIVGNSQFLMAGAGAAGPALEGGVVRTGMRATAGAVDKVWTEAGALQVHVIGETAAKGICGSGIVDLLSELFLNGWLDIRGKLLPDVPQVRFMEDEILAVEYTPGLYFYQSDMDEFLKTKAAAMTMVEYMMNLIGLTMEDISYFYVAGAFGTHIDKESAVTIGMYPDIEREKIISPGNTSLLGARKMLLNRFCREKVQEILDRMEYVQFGAVEDFLHLMAAAQAIPHTDLNRFPSVMKRLEERKNIK